MPFQCNISAISAVSGEISHLATCFSYCNRTAICIPLFIYLLFMYVLLLMPETAYSKWRVFKVSLRRLWVLFCNLSVWGLHVLPFVCVGSLPVLRLPPAKQNHAVEVDLIWLGNKSLNTTCQITIKMKDLKEQAELLMVGVVVISTEGYCSCWEESSHGCGHRTRGRWGRCSTGLPTSSTGAAERWLQPAGQGPNVMFGGERLKMNILKIQWNSFRKRILCRLL